MDSLFRSRAATEYSGNTNLYLSGAVGTCVSVADRCSRNICISSRQVQSLFNLYA